MEFLDFKPGLVGGHCIGVDPYYLKFKAIKSGLKPKMISSGREINDSIPYFIFKEVTKIFKSKFKSKKKLIFYLWELPLKKIVMILEIQNLLIFINY